MTDAAQIHAARLQYAADIIQAEGARSGNPVPADVALRAARQIYKIWYERVEPLDLKPGEVAQRLRERCMFSDITDAFEEY